jgi:hypothetical protein
MVREELLHVMDKSIRSVDRVVVAVSDKTSTSREQKSKADQLLMTH